jgi:xylulokinase
VVADCLGVPLVLTGTTEGAAYGAALLAAVAGGWFASVPEASSALVSTGAVTEPAAGDPYAAAYASFRRLYPVLAPEFRALDG